MSIYKGYDIRGTVPEEITPEFAHSLGCAFSQYIQNQTRDSLTVLIARDNRATSHELSEKLIAGLISQGINCIDIGLAPTPVFYFAADHFQCDGGIMVTASHNPPQYNGFKLVREHAIPIGIDSGLADLKVLIERNESSPTTPGTYAKKDIMNEYIAFHEKELGTINTASLKVVVDTGNGVSVLMVEPYLNALNTNVIPLYFEMDGTFPNHEPNPLKHENIKTLCETVIANNADCGIALDADGDRVIFVDEKGKPVSSDLISSLVAARLLEQHPNATMLYDIRSSHVVKDAIESAGGTAHMTRVGHAYIKLTMREYDALFAGELSGHFYFKATHYYEAPLLVIGMVLDELAQTKQPLSTILTPNTNYSHTGEINFEVQDKTAAIARLKKHFISQSPHIIDIDGMTMEFSGEQGDWWFNIRPSNTEDLLRLNLEASTQEIMREKQQEIETIIKQ